MLSYSSVQFICSAVHVSLQRMDCSTPGFPVHHQLPELAHNCVHRVSDAIQPSHPLASPSLPAFNLSKHHYSYIIFFLWLSHECFHCCFLCCCNTFQLEFYRANNKGEKQNSLPSCTGLFQKLTPRSVLRGVASLIKHSTNSDLVGDLKPRRQIYSEYHHLHRQFSDAMPTLVKSWSRTGGHW